MTGLISISDQDVQFAFEIVPKKNVDLLENVRFTVVLSSKERYKIRVYFN